MAWRVPGYIEAWEPPPLAEPTLTWADNFIKDLLTEEEKYHDVLLDISSDAISGTMSKLKVSSDEFKAGADILGEQALGMLYRASDEVLEETYVDIFPVITTLTPPPKGVDDFIDTSLFVTKTDMTDILENAALDIALKADKMKEDNESFWSGVQGWFGNRFADLDNLLSPLTDLVSDGIAWLFALPAQILFESFKSFFFEETKE